MMGAGVGLVVLLAVITFTASEQELAEASDVDFEDYQGQEAIEIGRAAGRERG